MATRQRQEREQANLGLEALANLEAEEAVLGSVLIDPGALALVRPILSDADFSSVYCGSVYRAMLRLADDHKAIDAVTLSAEITARGADPSPIIGYIAGVPSAMNAVHYARIVAELGTRRRLMDGAAKIVGLAADEDKPIDQILGDSYALLRGVADKSEPTMITSAEAASAFADDLGRWVNKPGAMWGLPTGLIQLDEMTGGFEDELVIIGGRPSHGKSALMLQIARHLAEKGHGIAYFSLEMSVRSLQQRLVSLRTRINGMAIRRGQITDDQHAEVYNALARIAELPIYWNVQNCTTVDKIVAQVAKLRMQHEIDVVVVDYLQLMDVPRAENRNLALGVVSRGLANLAHEQHLTVFAGSQLNRGVESRDEQIPRLSDLRESGNIEQDADAVIFVHRPEVRMMQEGKRKEEIPDDIRHKVQLILAKRRNGETGPLDTMLFWDEWGQFADAAR